MLEAVKLGDIPLRKAFIVFGNNAIDDSQADVFISSHTTRLPTRVMAAGLCPNFYN